MEYSVAIKSSEMLLHATTQMNFENIMLKEVTYCIIPFTWNIQNR